MIRAVPSIDTDVPGLLPPWSVPGSRGTRLRFMSMKDD
jgi:hypothetical protein